MPRPAETVVVAVTELRTLSEALPSLMGTEHPQLGIVTGAVEDVLTELYSSVVTGDEVGIIAAAGTQRRAIASLTVLLAELEEPPAEADQLYDAFEIAAGLLELVSPEL